MAISKAVFIADGAEAFIAGCEQALALARGGDEWLDEVDLKLANLSWDITHARMAGLVDEAIAVPERRRRTSSVGRARSAMTISSSAPASPAR